jgi:hypothetical protein
MPVAPGRAPGSPLAVPPAWLPLSWLAAAGVGLVGLGIALAATAETVVATPQAPTALATAHLAMLAFATTAVLGAAHQFGPVVAGRRLRSAAAGLFTLALWVPAAWLLPFAFATRRPALLEVAGATAFTAVCLAAWNLSGPLLRRGRGTPVLGLRLAVLYLVVTAGFGATYAFDVHHGWFLLFPRRVLAHAHLGLVGWIGLAYVAVAEKLWPMFLLAHRPSAKAGDWAVRLIASGVPLIAIGLLIPWRPMTWLGALVVVAGLGSHLVSLSQVIRHRRRRLELLHAFVLGSAAMLVVAVWAALAAGALDLSTTLRTRAVQTEVVALTFWVALAIVGHLHKIVPFISWSRLRSAGHTRSPDGKPLMFAHLYHAPTARVTCVAALVAAVSGVIGIAGGHIVLVRLSGVALAVTGITTSANLVNGPLRILRVDARRAAQASTAPDAVDEPRPDRVPVPTAP